MISPYKVPESPLILMNQGALFCTGNKKYPDTKDGRCRGREAWESTWGLGKCAHADGITGWGEEKLPVIVVQTGHWVIINILPIKTSAVTIYNNKCKGKMHY